MSKRILFGKDLHDAAEATMRLLAKAVKSTLGPSGKLALLDKTKQHLPSAITKDGVTVARHCLPLEDPVMNLIAGKILEVAEKTNAEAGDGTTTAIVLAEAMYLEALKYINNYDAVVIKREIENELPSILKKLDKKAKLIETLDQMIDVASISANNDRSIGEIVAKAIDSVGQDGYVTCEEGDSLEPTVNIIEGIQLNKGASDIRFLKNQNKLTLEKPYILVYDGKINDEYILYAIVESYSKRSPFVVIGDIEPKVKMWMLKNSLNANMPFVHIPPAYYKDTRHKMLTDLAISVGADLIDPTTQNPKTIKEEQLGRADSIDVTRYTTNIINGHGSKEKIIDRINNLKEEMENAKSEYDKDILRERIGRLTTGVAIIGVGGKTEDEMKERKDRFDDALNATRAALLEGVIAGGGEALLRIASKLNGNTVGEKILQVALMSPFKQIVKNAGGNTNEITSQVLETDKGYDAKTHEYKKLLRAGIIDPVKVTKSALENAISIVDLLINLEVLSVDIKSNNPMDFLDKLQEQ